MHCELSSYKKEVYKRIDIFSVHFHLSKHVMFSFPDLSILEYLVSIFFKVIKKIVRGRFEILDNDQHGFRPSRTTQTGAINLVEFMYKRLDRDWRIISLFLDSFQEFYSLSNSGFYGLAIFSDVCYLIG